MVTGKHTNFLHLSDPHFRDDGGASLAHRNLTWEPGEILKKFLDNKDFSEFSFVTVTGDLLNDGTASDYESLRTILEDRIPADLPLLVMLGNHDVKPAFYEGWLGQEASDKPYYYSTIIDGLRVIVLDTGVSWQHGGNLDDEQVDWFSDLVSTPSGELGSIILQHHPFEIAWDREREYFSASGAFQQALAASDVRAFFTGHLHMSRSSLIYGLPQYTTSSLAWGIHRINKTFWDTAQLGYATCEISETHIDHCHQVFYPDVHVIAPADVNSNYADLHALFKGVL